VPPVTTSTINNVVVQSGTAANWKIYDGVKFTGGSSSRAVVQIDSSTSYVLFRNCIVATNASGWNGVSINDSGGNIHDITFDNCQILYQSRFGFECTSRSSTGVYQRIKLLNSIVEPQGGGGVSFDSTSDAESFSVVDNTTIEGTGNLPDSWTAAFETNGTRAMTFTHNRIWQSFGTMWNIQRHNATDCEWVFSDNILDASHHDPDQKVAMRNVSADIEAENITGGVFARNTVIGAAPNGGVGYLSGCHNMNFTTSTFKDPRGGSYSSLKLQSGSSGDLF
jgi:hypothetical protein